MRNRKELLKQIYTITMTENLAYEETEQQINVLNITNEELKNLFK
jgi:hypothetical protein